MFSFKHFFYLIERLDFHDLKVLEKLSQVTLAVVISNHEAFHRIFCYHNMGCQYPVKIPVKL